MASAGPDSDKSRLDSWKEIARYLNREIRTAIRWEKERGLPVHRLPGGRGVFAYREEIHAWLVGQPKEGAEPEPKHQLPRMFLIAVAGVAVTICLVVVVVWTHWVGPRPARSSGIHALAVLPLQNLSREGGQDYSSDGLTEALITDLAQIHSLRVVSRTSVMQYKQTTKTLPVIARELGVDGIVEGAVLHTSGQVRITVQLIKARTDEHLWAATFEGRPDDVVALQRTVSRAIVQAVQTTVTPEERERLVRVHPVNAEAYDLYLKGRFFWNKRNREGLDKAVELLKQSVQKEPDYAVAYAGLADAYILHGLTAVPAHDLPLAKAAALKALELDEGLAAAHTSLGAIKALYDWDWAGSEREFKRAIELDPNYATAHHWYASLCLGILHRDQEAAAELQKAHQLDPLSLPILSDFASSFVGLGQFDRAIELYYQTIEMDPNFGPVHFALSIVYEKHAMYREALMELREFERLSRAEELLPVELTRARDKSEYQRALRWQLEQENKHSRQPGFWRYDQLASLHARLGERDLALADLNIAVQQRDPLAIFATDFNQFGSLRSDPRMRLLLRRMNLGQ